jgi:hypothetical protein
MCRASPRLLGHEKHNGTANTALARVKLTSTQVYRKRPRTGLNDS